MRKSNTRRMLRAYTYYASRSPSRLLTELSELRAHTIQPELSFSLNYLITTALPALSLILNPPYPIHLIARLITNLPFELRAHQMKCQAFHLRP
jgi:hypothetical protein